MKSRDLKNLYQDNTLREKVDEILSISDMKKQYRICQVILEYVNIYYLTQKLKIKLKDYNIMKIIKEYQKIDQELADKLISINSLYNIIDREGITPDDIEELLFKTDYIYGIIRNK